MIETHVVSQASVRNKPGYDPTQYSIDWTNIVTSYLKKQLSEISLPSAPRLGLNIKQTFKGVLTDPESQERWLSRFSYTCVLAAWTHTNPYLMSTTAYSFLVHFTQRDSWIVGRFSRGSFRISLPATYHRLVSWLS